MRVMDLIRTALTTTAIAILMVAFAGSDALAANGYAAVWQPGRGAQWWRSGMTLDQFKSLDKTYFKKGLRIQSVAMQGRRYTVVWRRGSGAQWWRAGMTLSQMKAQDATYFKQGLRIHAMELQGGRYTAVWRPGSGAQWWRAGMSLDQMKAQDKTYFKKGLRIHALEIENGRFTAVWRPGSGAQWWRTGLTGSQIQSQDATYFKQGLRIAVMEIANSRYTAVWRPGSGTQWWGRRRCSVDLKTEDAAYFSRNLRLRFIETDSSGVGLYRYPWKNGVTYTVGQGNNNPSGSHNGSQSFAFDFSLPSGAQIRAARAGTVEWLQESQSSNYNPNQPTTPTNQPYPGGDLRNWGNAVRLRHAGGFTSWYFHIQRNGVLVNVGDKVSAGQVIARSDNTGRSSGPHLHFQVQADSNNWGQSVRISFGKCRIPRTGDRVKP